MGRSSALTVHPAQSMGGRGRKEVVGIAQNSTEAEFAAFVAANYTRLLHVADLITGDHGRAEDLLQTVLTGTFLRWRRIRQANPLGYVRAGLVNARTDWWRRAWHRE